MRYFKVFFIISFFLCANSVFAYEPETTHAGITEQAVLFYNKNFSRKLSDAEKELVISGAIAEDYPYIRVLNHFYDPIRKIGIYNYRTSKDWATDTLTENKYTWPAAIKKYAEGNEKDAFVYLGHILHLIEDLTVPDHTRNDPHVGDPVTGESTYETWASKNKDRGTMAGLSNDFIGAKPILFDHILDFFEFLANYSNRNFFGDDSIKNNVYQYEEPKILERRGNYGIGLDKSNNQKFNIVIVKEDNSGNLVFKLIDNDTSVISGYFDRLSKQAILGGAGVIDLFFREAEKARADHLIAEKMRQEEEARQATELEQKINNSGAIGHAVFGLQNLISENIINPAVSSVSSFASNLAKGSVVVIKEIPNLGNFVAFTLNVVATEAYAETSTTIKNGYDKIISSLQNISSVFSTSADKNPASVSLVPELGNPISKSQIVYILQPDQLGGETAKLEVASQEDMLSLLNAAIAELESLQKFVLAQNEVADSQLASVVKTGTISPSNAYVAGFGGGGEVPIKVDSVSEKSQINLEIGFPSAPNEATSTEEGATSTDPIIEETPVVDTVPPDISLEIKECADSMSQDACLVATMTINIFWSSLAEDLDHFEIELNGDISSTFSTSSTLSVQNRDKINISATAVDKAGNRSEKIEKTAEINLSPVVINEIAWNGTNRHSEDEWIELYNKTNNSIDLAGWNLYSKTDNSPNLSLAGTIAPFGYYLIERKNSDETDEEAQSGIKDIPADLWISFGLGLNNGGENLILARASTTMDEAPFCANWCGSSNSRTYERYSPESEIKSSSWTQNNGEIKNGKNTEGAIVFGTPKARNSVNYLIAPGNILHTNLELQKKNSPYLIPSGAIFEIASDGNLTIGPGVVLKFGQNAMTKTAGNLITKGTSDDPVIFTSFFDDEYAGDTNGDGVCDKANASSTAVCPAPGNWQGLWILNTAANSNIENTIFRYGGTVTGAKRAMVDIESVSPKISGSVFEFAVTDGLYLNGSDAELSGNIFRNNNKVTSMISSSIGLNISGGKPPVIGNKFTDNSIGLSINGSSAIIKDNEFSGNSVKTANLSNITGGEISGNTTPDDMFAQYSKDMINLSGFLSYINSTTTFGENQMAYFISGTTNVSASSTLEIKEESKMMFSNSGAPSQLYVDGNLIVSGTGDMPTVFSSNDSTEKGSWQGINMRAGSQAEIKGAILKNAVTALTYKKSPIILEDTVFSNNKLGISADNFSEMEKALNVIFDNNNTATTSPAGMW